MRSQGLTLLEMLIALSLFGVALALSSNLIFGNPQIASRQVLAGRIQEDARLALARMSDVIAQAAYIYPLNARLTVPLPGGGSRSLTATTGRQNLALLVPSGNAYCPATPTTTYCAYLYRVEARDPYADDLGPALPGHSGQVLVEYQARGLAWPANTLPPRDWTDGADPSRGVVADSVDAGGTDLSGVAFAGVESPVDKNLLIPGDTVEVSLDSPEALIGSVRLALVLSYNNGLLALQQGEVLARAIPRAIPP